MESWPLTSFQYAPAVYLFLFFSMFYVHFVATLFYYCSHILNYLSHPPTHIHTPLTSFDLYLSLSFSIPHLGLSFYTVQCVDECLHASTLCA